MLPENPLDGVFTPYADGEGEELFLGPRDEWVQSKTVQRAVQRFAGEAGLENITPHVLRHSFAKALIDNGVTLEKVATLFEVQQFEYGQDLYNSRRKRFGRYGKWVSRLGLAFFLCLVLWGELDHVDICIRIT